MKQIPTDLIAAAGLLTIIASGCATGRVAQPDNVSTPTVTAASGMPSDTGFICVMPPVQNGPVPSEAQALPRAVIYRCAPQYVDKVPVTLSADGKSIVSYPAPTDLRNTAPIRLCDGFLLDRRGVNEHTAFTRYTYSEYEALEHAPAPSQLLKDIIPGSGITDLHTLPMSAAEAATDTTAVNTWIKGNI